MVVAHRISSALRADRVLVMDGRRTAYGSHDDLLDRSPLYRDLVGAWSPAGGAATVPAAHRPETHSQPSPCEIRIASTRLRAPVFRVIAAM